MKTEDLALFHRIVETGSVMDAADLLNLPKSTVSRRLQALEEELDIKLFHRQSRAMTLTSAGSHFYQRSQDILAQLDETLFEMTKDEAEISGHLRIQVFPIPGIMLLMNTIYRFMDLHPKLTVEVISTSEVMDMVKHNVDVAFVIEPSIEALEHLVVRPIFETNLRFYASPNYLARHGTPASPREIEQHNVILFRLSNGRVFNELVVGEDEIVKVRGNFCTNSIDVAAESVLQGRGIAYLPSEAAEEYVSDGSLVTLFPEKSAHQGECFLVYPSRRFVSLASRRFIDFIMAELVPDGVPTRMGAKRKSTCNNSGSPFPDPATRYIGASI